MDFSDAMDTVPASVSFPSALCKQLAVMAMPPQVPEALRDEANSVCACCESSLPSGDLRHLRLQVRHVEGHPVLALEAHPDITAGVRCFVSLFRSPRMHTLTLPQTPLFRLPDGTRTTFDTAHLGTQRYYLRIGDQRFLVSSARAATRASPECRLLAIVERHLRSTQGRVSYWQPASEEKRRSARGHLAEVAALFGRELQAALHAPSCPLPGGRAPINSQVETHCVAAAKAVLTKGVDSQQRRALALRVERILVQHALVILPGDWIDRLSASDPAGLVSGLERLLLEEAPAPSVDALRAAALTFNRLDALHRDAEEGVGGVLSKATLTTLQAEATMAASRCVVEDGVVLEMDAWKDAINGAIQRARATARDCPGCQLPVFSRTAPKKLCNGCVAYCRWCRMERESAAVVAHAHRHALDHRDGAVLDITAPCHRTIEEVDAVEAWCARVVASASEPSVKAFARKDKLPACTCCRAPLPTEEAPESTRLSAVKRSRVECSSTASPSPTHLPAFATAPSPTEDAQVSPRPPAAKRPRTVNYSPTHSPAYTTAASVDCD